VLASLRIDRLAGVALALVLLASCMRIYPDPELPDVVVSWFADECDQDTGDVVVALVGVDHSSRVEMTSACTDNELTFKDVKRERYRVEATMFHRDGTVFLQSSWDADLRNGFDENVELYFSRFAGFRVAWTFDMGASCTSLGADAIALDLLPNGDQIYADCRNTPYYGYTDIGTYMLRLRAVAGPQTVAISPESAPFTLTSLDPMELGTMTLSPCAPACPEP
jgi:hypothetical protein